MIDWTLVSQLCQTTKETSVEDEEILCLKQRLKDHNPDPPATVAARMAVLSWYMLLARTAGLHSVQSRY